jgi:hypothetical protein
VDYRYLFYWRSPCCWYTVFILRNLTLSERREDLGDQYVVDVGHDPETKTGGELIGLVLTVVSYPIQISLPVNCGSHRLQLWRN